MKWTTVAAAVAIGSCARPQWVHLSFGGLHPLEQRASTFHPDVRTIRLDNGMRVALVEDHRTNIVSVTARYEIGAAADPTDLVGLAHLVEHATFLATDANGARTLADRMSEVTLRFNAETTYDETHYQETALAEHVDDLVDLEAARLTERCDQIGDALFDRERDVVLAEQSQRDTGNDVASQIDRALWGADHPYARPLGSDDVARATRDDVCRFVSKEYGPDRLTLVIDGGFDADEVIARVHQDFDPVAAPTGHTPVSIAAAPLDGARTEIGDGDGVAALVYLPRPPWGDDDAAVDEIATELLSAALQAHSPDHDWLGPIEIGDEGDERARMNAIVLNVTARASLGDAATYVFDTASALAGALPAADVAKARSELRTSYEQRFDRIDGRATWLARFAARGDAARLLDDELARIDAITPEQIAARLRGYVASRARVIDLVPGGEATARRAPAAAPHDVERWRPDVDPADANRPVPLPATTTTARTLDYRLDNGLHVVLAPDPRSPVIDARLVFPIGADADSPDLPGVARLSAEALDHDRDAHYAHDDRAALDWMLALGGVVDTDVTADTTTYRITGDATWADWHLWRLFWLLDAGTYAKLTDIHLHANGWGYAEEVGHFVMRQKLFGSSHPYASPEVSDNELRLIRTEDLDAFRAAHYRARGATLIVSGAFDQRAMRDEIARLFGGWSSDPPEAVAAVPPIDPASGPSWIAVDHADAQQGSLTLAFAAMSDPVIDAPARAILTELIDARLSDLRERSGVTYGAQVGYGSGAFAHVLGVSVDVDPAQTAAALAEIRKELATIRDGGKDIAGDFVRARRRALSDALAHSSGAAAVAERLEAQVIAHRGVAGDDGGASRIAATTLDESRAFLAAELSDAHLVIVVRGTPDVVDATLKGTPDAPTDVVHYVAN